MTPNEEIMPNMETIQEYPERILSGKADYNDINKFIKYKSANYYEEVLIDKIKVYLINNLGAIFNYADSHTKLALITAIRILGIAELLPDMIKISQKETDYKVKEQLQKALLHFAVETSLQKDENVKLINAHKNSLQQQIDNIQQQIIEITQLIKGHDQRSQEKWQETLSEINRIAQSLEESSRQSSEEAQKKLLTELRREMNRLAQLMDGHGTADDDEYLDRRTLALEEIKLNKKAYEEQRSELLQKYPDHFAIFSGGELVITEKDMDEAIARARKLDLIGPGKPGPYLVQLVKTEK